MHNVTIFASVGILLLSSFAAPTASAKPAATRPAWRTLTGAYETRQTNVIKRYMHSSDKSARLYAAALIDLSARNFSSLPKDGKGCYNAKPLNGAAAAAYFGCLLAVANGLTFAHQTKLHYIWNAKLIAFYERYSDLVNEGTGSGNPADIKAVRSPAAATVRKWPKQTVSVNKNWSDIALHENGSITAYIDGKPIQVAVDTGSTGITISKSDIRRYGLGSALIPLGVKLGVSGANNKEAYMSNLYYVKRLRLGPIVISDAYISDGPNIIAKNVPGAKAGLDVLSALKRFSMSSSKISHFPEKQKGVCGRMLFTRNNVARGFESPFFEVPTNIGRIGLLLDSGSLGRGPFRVVTVQLDPPKVKPALHTAGGLTFDKKNIKSYILENGRKTRLRSDIFNISVAGIATRGSFELRAEGEHDPKFAGAMTFNFLKKAKVAYDFPDRKMCIIPDKPPTSAAADSSEAQP